MKVIITGASKGIGRGIAAALAAKGHDLGLIARSSELLDELSAACGVHRLGRCAAAPCDLRSWQETHAAVEHIVAELQGVDALINNAGLVIRKDASTLSLDEWHAMVETNVNGLFYATRSVLPHLKRQRSGVVINVSSISGRVPLPGGSGYAATKYAVTGFSESLFHEVRDDGIRVATIFPGSVDSESHRHNADTDHSWKVKPEEVGEVCHAILTTPAATCISQVEIRPLRRPPG